MAKTRLQLTWYNKDKALIPTETGKYGYAWVEPSDPRYCETHTLIMDEYVEGIQTPKSDDFQYSDQADFTPQEDNILILGESGDVLKTLTRVPELAKKYVGKVKLVYIDPPFNTAQTFASYEDNLEHSIWLTMMRDRLLHLKRLLSKDGSIWVHLDNIEVHRMRLLLDETFGAQNFLAEIAWEKTFKPRNDSDGFSSRHDIILVYGKETALINRLPRTGEMDAAYSNPDNDPKGAWTNASVTAPGSADHQGMVYGIQHPITGEIVYPSVGRHWAWGQPQMLEILRGWNNTYKLTMIEDKEERAKLCNLTTDEVREDVPAIIMTDFSESAGRKVFERGNWPVIYPTGDGTGGLRRKTYLSGKPGKVPEDIWFYTEVGSNDEAKNEIKELFHGETPFSTPKPERLLERIIHIATNPGDLVLDCFAGSGTTAAVAQKMGRRWITCELLEKTFHQYTLPRLKKIVMDEDAGGITRSSGERIADKGVTLPDGMSADEAADFNKYLNKLIADDDELKKSDVVKKLKSMSKTKRMKEVINWHGGGGFQVAHLSPECFDYDPKYDSVMMTKAAKGDVLIRSVAANLGFKLLDKEAGNMFDGEKGRSLLKVIDGVATTEIVDWLVSRIRPDKTIVLATIGVVDGVREHLRKSCKGSRIVVIPDDIFHYSKGDEE